MKLVKKIPGVEQQIQDKKNPIYPSDPNDVKKAAEFLKSKEVTAVEQS